MSINRRVGIATDFSACCYVLLHLACSSTFYDLLHRQGHEWSWTSVVRVSITWCCVSITGHQRKRQKGGEVTHSFKPFPTGLQREAGKQ